MQKNLLREVIKTNCIKQDIPMSVISQIIGKSDAQTRKLIREESLKYEDVRAISRFLKFTDEDKIKLL